MSKRFRAYPCIFFATSILMGCGNKGDLFLPADQQLARELEAATDRTNDAESDPATDAADKKKRPANEPSQ